MPSFFTTFIPFVVIELQRHHNPFLLTLKQTCLLVNQSMCSPGGTLDFKWQGWSNGGKNQSPQKYLYQNVTPPPKKKNPMPNFRAIKFPESIKWYNYNKSSDCFEYPKNSLLKSSCLKKYLPKFSYPPKIPNSKFQTPKKLFGHPCHLKSGVPLLGHLLSYKCSICLYVVNAIMLVVLISCSLQMCGTLTEK